MCRISPIQSATYRIPPVIIMEKLTPKYAKTYPLLELEADQLPSKLGSSIHKKCNLKELYCRIFPNKFPILN